MKHAAGVDMSDVTSLGEITAEGLRQVFPQAKADFPQW
jgi:hypothetical protein